MFSNKRGVFLFRSFYFNENNSQSLFIECIELDNLYSIHFQTGVYALYYHRQNTNDVSCHHLLIKPYIIKYVKFKVSPKLFLKSVYIYIQPVSRGSFIESEQ